MSTETHIRRIPASLFRWDHIVTQDTKTDLQLVRVWLLLPLWTHDAALWMGEADEGREWDNTRSRSVNRVANRLREVHFSFNGNGRHHHQMWFCMNCQYNLDRLRVRRFMKGESWWSASVATSVCSYPFSYLKPGVEHLLTGSFERQVEEFGSSNTVPCYHLRTTSLDFVCWI